MTLIKKGQKHDKKLHKWFIEGALPGQAHCTAHPVCWPRACLLKPLQDLRLVFDIPIKVNKMKKNENLEQSDSEVSHQPGWQTL